MSCTCFERQSVSKQCCSPSPSLRTIYVSFLVTISNCISIFPERGSLLVVKSKGDIVYRKKTRSADARGVFTLHFLSVDIFCRS